MKVASRFGKQRWNGWWFGVWQDDRLVAFGAGYRDKRRCFKHERKSREQAEQREMPEVKCTNPCVEKES